MSTTKKRGRPSRADLALREQQRQEALARGEPDPELKRKKRKPPRLNDGGSEEDSREERKKQRREEREDRRLKTAKPRSEDTDEEETPKKKGRKKKILTAEEEAARDEERKRKYKELRDRQKEKLERKCEEREEKRAEEKRKHEEHQWMAELSSQNLDDNSSDPPAEMLVSHTELEVPTLNEKLKGTLLLFFFVGPRPRRRANSLMKKNQKKMKRFLNRGGPWFYEVGEYVEVSREKSQIKRRTDDENGKEYVGDKDDDNDEGDKEMENDQVQELEIKDSKGKASDQVFLGAGSKKMKRRVERWKREAMRTANKKKKYLGFGESRPAKERSVPKSRKVNKMKIPKKAESATPSAEEFESLIQEISEMNATSADYIEDILNSF